MGRGTGMFLASNRSLQKLGKWNPILPIPGEMESILFAHIFETGWFQPA